jgi:hypothetical protein
MDCGGKRSATPLWIGPAVLVVHPKSAVAASLCQRSPKPVVMFMWRFLTLAGTGFESIIG